MSNLTSYCPFKWELFESEPGYQAAEKRLNKALVRTIKAVAKASPCGEEAMAKELGKAASEHMYPAMQAERKFGATDTEPRYRAAQALIDWAKDQLDISRDEYCPELGDWLPL